MRTVRFFALGGYLLGLAFSASTISGCGSSVEEGTRAEKAPGQDEGQKASMKFMMENMKPTGKKR